MFAKAASSTRPAHARLVAECHSWLVGQLAKHPELSTERRADYANAAAVVFQRMTATALVRLRQNTRVIRFYASLEEMTAELARTYPSVRKLLAQGQVVGGGYVRQRRELHLDGGIEREGTESIVGRYAHEFTHAINGPQRQLSGSQPWIDAWNREIVQRRLSPLALQNAHEGFAEFGRIVYTGTYSRDQLKKTYALCVEVWKGTGLW